MQHYQHSDIQQLTKPYRRNFINSLSGFKSANLIGTADKSANTNLAVFSSVHHIGANPPLLGFNMRPVTAERHTYENIMDSGYFTINAIAESFYKQAHQTAASYGRYQSEFEATGLTPRWVKDFNAPFVAESPLQIGLSFIEEYMIQANGTILIIGRIEHIFISEKATDEAGRVLPEKLGLVAISGLDGYHSTKRLDTLGHPKVE